MSRHDEQGDRIDRSDRDAPLDSGDRLNDGEETEVQVPQARTLRRHFEHTRSRRMRTSDVLAMVADRAYGRLVAVARRRLGSEMGRYAEDIVQQALMAVLRNDEFDASLGIEAAIAYVGRQAAWQAAELLRRRRPQLLENVVDEAGTDDRLAAGHEESSSEVLADSFLRDVLDRVGLKPAERAIIDRILAAPDMTIQELAAEEDPAKDLNGVKDRAASLRQAKSRAVRRLADSVGWTKEEADVYKHVYRDGLAQAAEAAHPARTSEEFHRVFFSAARKFHAFLYRDGEAER